MKHFLYICQFSNGVIKNRFRPKPLQNLRHQLQKA